MREGWTFIIRSLKRLVKLSLSMLIKPARTMRSMPSSSSSFVKAASKASWEPSSFLSSVTAGMPASLALSRA